MALISGVVAYRTTVTVVAASGDGAAIAAKFDGIVIPDVSNAAAVAANVSGVVTVYWAAPGVRVADELALTKVVNILAADLALTAPITATVVTQAAMAA